MQVCHLANPLLLQCHGFSPCSKMFDPRGSFPTPSGRNVKNIEISREFWPFVAHACARVRVFVQFSRVDGTSDALYAMELALQLEKFVYRKLKVLHSLREECNDPEFTDRIESYLRFTRVDLESTEPGANPKAPRVRC